MEMHRLPSEIESLPVEEFNELLAAFKMHSEQLQQIRGG